MKLTIQQIASLLQLSPDNLHPAVITGFLTDSRSLSNPAEQLFFAFPTASNDGHRYISDLYARGVRNFVVSRRPENASEAMPEANFLVVDSTIDALQRLGAANRRASAAEVVAIVGSRGKTTLKEWLFTVMAHAGRKVVRSPRSYNSQIGVALSLMNIEADDSVAFIEAGISRPGEMARLQAATLPDTGIFTNLLSDHGEGFASDEEKLREKALMFSGCREIIYSADNPMVGRVMAETAPGARHWRWTAAGTPGADVAISTTRRDGSTLLHFAFGDSKGEAEVAFTAPHDIENLCSLIAYMALRGYRPAEIADAVGRLDPVVTRTDVIEGVAGSSLVVDRFPADLQSLDVALDFTRRRIQRSRKSTLILGDLTDDPLHGTPELYAALRDVLTRRPVDRIIAVGPGLSANEALWRPEGEGECLVYGSMGALMDAIGKLGFAGGIVLVKGPAKMDFGLVVDFLEARRHETVLDVNLDAIVHNFNFFKSRLRPTTGIVAMVKAFGYGAGSYELAKTLQAQGAAYLAVAVLDEGTELRRAGITMPIMVLNPRVVNYEEMFANRLEPEIFSFDELEEIIAQARRHNITGYPIHIKFDTGMHRLGFVEQDLERLGDLLERSPEVVPMSMFSHLAAADDPMLDDYTRRQFEIFDRCCDAIQARFPFHIMRHILNSTGITRFPEHQHDLVRLGICLYGVETMNDGTQQGLRRVSSLRTNIISIKTWPEGTPIGYNCRDKCSRTSRIATIPIGYADGIDRHFGNGHLSVWVNGHRCPTIGNICMDACMIDVTDCGENCRVGDSVEIFGEHVDVTELASILGTIPYEILTSVSMRVKRVYYRE